MTPIVPQTKKIALSDSFQSTEQVIYWMITYAKNPQPNRMSSALRALSELDLQVATFASQILKKHPEQLKIYLEELNIEGISRDKSKGLITAIWLSEIDQSQGVLNEISEKGKTKWIKEIAKKLLHTAIPDPYSVTEINFQTSMHLDVLWGQYFYSHETKACEMIVDIAIVLFEKMDAIGKNEFEKKMEREKTKPTLIPIQLNKEETEVLSKTATLFIKLCLHDDNLYGVLLKKLTNKIKTNTIIRDLLKEISSLKQVSKSREGKNTIEI